MKQSQMFIPTLREIPKDAEITSHQICVKGGYVKQIAAGVYTYLPLAYKIIGKVETIIREELNKIGCTELFMPVLQPKDLWEESGRWSQYGKELMRLADRHERDFCLGPTHEEIITASVRDGLKSYKQLPLALYQIQTKFRDEFRPRFGLMRGREFIMKDLYTFHTSEADLETWYQKVRGAYIAIFTRLGLQFRIVSADSGNMGGSSSEEFMALCEVGEDTIVYNEAGTFASNYEHSPLAEGAPSPDGNGTILHAKGIEIGHIFKLGTKYSAPLHCEYADETGKKQPAIMGCYGIGVSRILMAVLEQRTEDFKVLWPAEIAPFKIHILPLAKPGTEGYRIAEALYQKLNSKHAVLFDDRNETAGVKFNDADLIGIRYQIIVGRQAEAGIIELKDRATGAVKEVKIAALTKEQFD